MEQIAVTHGFVKKLAHNIRGRYGREVRHTEVIELIAAALGQKVGPMMHALKHVHAIGTDEDINSNSGCDQKTGHPKIGGSATTSSAKAICNVLAAIRELDQISLPLYMGLLAPTSSLAKFVLAYAHRFKEGLDTRTSIVLLLESFDEEEFLVELAASAVVSGAITDEGLARFSKTFDYGDGLHGAILGGALFPRKMLAWAASHAVAHGFLSFEGDRAVVTKPPISPKQYGYKVNPATWTTNAEGKVADGREAFLRHKCTTHVELLATTMNRNWELPGEDDIRTAVSNCLRAFAQDAVVGGAWPMTRVEEFAQKTINDLLVAKYERPY